MFFPRLKSILLNSAIVLLALVVSLAVAEGTLRWKNASMQNYDIEMWRYARLLKRPNPDPRIGHEHVLDAEAVLQSVRIRTNAWGLRGGPISEKPAPGVRRILMLGNSYVLGWGVAEDQTMSAELQKLFAKSGEQAEVLNAGIGNYNTQRSVEHFFSALTPLQPTDIVYVASFASAETLRDTPSNFFLRHSQLAVMAWVAIQNTLRQLEGGSENLAEHYRRLYQPGTPGLAVMESELGKLAAYGRDHHIRVIVVVMPDIRRLPAKTPFAEDAAIVGAARAAGLPAVDLLPVFQHDSYESLLVIPGDFHFNAQTHARIAAAVYQALTAKIDSR